MSSYESEPVESGNSFDDERLKKIRKDFDELRDRLSRPEIKEIGRKFYNIKNPKKSF